MTKSCPRRVQILIVGLYYCMSLDAHKPLKSSVFIDSLYLCFVLGTFGYISCILIWFFLYLVFV